MNRNVKQKAIIRNYVWDYRYEYFKYYIMGNFFVIISKNILIKQ